MDKGVYRFRAYNGSQARFDGVGLKLKATGVALPSSRSAATADCHTPVPLTQLVLGTGERADLLVGFRGLPTGALVEMGNNAPTPYSNGARNLHKNGVPLPQIIQFRVTNAPGFTPALSIAGMNLRLVTPITRLETAPAFAAARVRTHSLVEITGPAGPVMALLNNRMFHDPDQPYAAAGQEVKPRASRSGSS